MVLALGFENAEVWLGEEKEEGCFKERVVKSWKIKQLWNIKMLTSEHSTEYISVTIWEETTQRQEKYHQKKLEENADVS